MPVDGGDMAIIPPFPPIEPNEKQLIISTPLTDPLPTDPPTIPPEV